MAWPFIAATSDATTWVSQPREWSAREQFDFAARSDVIATVKFLREVEPSPEVAASHAGGLWVEAARLRSIRGSLPDRFQIGMGGMTGIVHRPDGLVGKTAVVLMSVSGSTWVLNESPYHLGRGVLEVDATSRDSIELRMADAVSRRSLKSLSQRADWIVRSTVMPGRGGYVLANPETIAGGPLSPQCRIDSPILLKIRTEYLLFLVCTGDGRPGVLSTDAGAMEIKDGVVTALDQPIDAVLRQARLNRLAEPAHPDSEGTR